MRVHRFARFVFVSAMLAILLAVSPPASGAGQAASDESAMAIVDRMMTALGGRENWDRTRFIQFTFVRGDTRLKLTWDKWTGRYRLDATTPEGQPYVVLMNVETREGTAYVDGTPVADAERDEYLQRALRIWAGET